MRNTGQVNIKKKQQVNHSLPIPVCALPPYRGCRTHEPEPCPLRCFLKTFILFFSNGFVFPYRFSHYVTGWCCFKFLFTFKLHVVTFFIRVGSDSCIFRCVDKVHYLCRKFAFEFCVFHFIQIYKKTYKHEWV